MTEAKRSVSVVVRASERWEDTFRCLVALQRAAPEALETIVVDDGTTDETRLALPLLEGLRVLRNEAPHGRAAALNQGAAIAEGEWIAFLDGAEPSPGWLAPLARLASGDPDAAVVGSRTVTPAGLVDQDGIALAYASPWPLAPWRAGAGEIATPSAEVSEVPAVSGAAMLVRADVLRELDGFAEEFWDDGHDVDLCLRARDLGGKVLLARESVATVVAGAAISDRSAALLNRRWLGRTDLFDPAGHLSRAIPAPRPGRPPLSAVVPSLNALRTIAGCTEDLIANLGPDDELLLVDAGSDDGTREFARLLAKDRASVRLVPCDPSAGLAGAARAGLAEATRAVAVLVPASVGAPDGFLDELTRVLEQHQGFGVVALAAQPGFCAAGEASVLRAVGDAAPESFEAPDAGALDAAVRGVGSRLLLVASR